MTQIESVMLLGYALAALISFRDKRAVGWLAAGALNFIASSIYWRSGMPQPEVFSGLADASVCLGIYFLGAYRWEMFVWRIFQGMLLVNVLMAASQIGVFTHIGREPYSITLEALNWAAILFIGGNATLQRIWHASSWLSAPSRSFHRAMLALRQKRAAPPFTAQEQK